MPGVSRLAVHDTGDGPAVLFLHAFPLDSTQWDHQVAALSGRFRCLRPDMWGCGDSGPAPDGASTLADFAGAVIAELDQLGVSRFSAVGLSMGGYVAFALWRQAPERIASVVLSNTRAGADTDQTRADRRALAERVLREGDVEFLVEPNVSRLLGPKAQLEVHITDPLRGRVRRCSPAGIAFAARAMAQRDDSVALLGAIAAPALVIAGSDDGVIPGEDSRALAAGVPGARFVELDCGHLSNLEQPHEFNRVVGEFLASIPRA